MCTSCLHFSLTFPLTHFFRQKAIMKLMNMILSNKQNTVAQVCNSSYPERGGRRIDY
jgi:hypothetical protein